MAKCSFCGEQIAHGTGKMFVYNSGKIDYFCSRTCEKHVLKLEHKPLRIPWTKAYQQQYHKNKKKE